MTSYMLDTNMCSFIIRARGLRAWIAKQGDAFVSEAVKEADRRTGARVEQALSAALLLVIASIASTLVDMKEVNLDLARLFH